jgi:hypothetical protein
LGGGGRERYFETCPSRSRMVFICERRSGSCVVGVYVEAALGTRTGVVGSGFMVSGEGDIGALCRQCTRLRYSKSPRDSLSVADWKQTSKRLKVGFLESNKAMIQPATQLSYGAASC